MVHVRDLTISLAFYAPLGGEVWRSCQSNPSLQNGI